MYEPERGPFNHDLQKAAAKYINAQTFKTYFYIAFVILLVVAIAALGLNLEHEVITDFGL